VNRPSPSEEEDQEEEDEEGRRHFSSKHYCGRTTALSVVVVVVLLLSRAREREEKVWCGESTHFLVRFCFFAKGGSILFLIRKTFQSLISHHI
jgi:hypothetical protein